MTTPHASEIPDVEELLAQAAMGDRAAFLDLYDATAPRSFATCLNTLQNGAAAESALLAAYTSLWDAAGAYRPGMGDGRLWVDAHVQDVARDRADVRPAQMGADTATPDLVTPPPRVRARLRKAIGATDGIARTLARWALGAVAGAATAVAVVYVAASYLDPGLPDELTSTQLTGDAGLTYSAQLDGRTGTLQIARQGGAAAGGTREHVWLSDGAGALVPLGYLTAGGGATFQLPGFSASRTETLGGIGGLAAPAVDTQTLATIDIAITAEAVGGDTQTPPPQPGPILARGPLIDASTLR
ncbi:MAG: hypothetical protein AAFO93_04335 [Pseudomonadota bacterium]